MSVPANRVHSFTSASHVLPVKEEAHAQWNPANRSVHVPPLRQGLSPHSSVRSSAVSRATCPDNWDTFRTARRMALPVSRSDPVPSSSDTCSRRSVVTAVLLLTPLSNDSVSEDEDDEDEELRSSASSRCSMDERPVSVCSSSTTFPDPIAAKWMFLSGALHHHYQLLITNYLSMEKTTTNLPLKHQLSIPDQDLRTLLHAVLQSGHQDHEAEKWEQRSHAREPGPSKWNWDCGIPLSAHPDIVQLLSSQSLPPARLSDYFPEY